MIQSIFSHLECMRPFKWRQNISLWPWRHHACVRLDGSLIHIANAPPFFFTESTVTGGKWSSPPMASSGGGKKREDSYPQGYRDLSTDSGAPNVNNSSNSNDFDLETFWTSGSSF